MTLLNTFRESLMWSTLCFIQCSLNKKEIIYPICHLALLMKFNVSSKSKNQWYVKFRASSTSNGNRLVYAKSSARNY